MNEWDNALSWAVADVTFRRQLPAVRESRRGELKPVKTHRRSVDRYYRPDGSMEREHWEETITESWDRF